MTPSLDALKDQLRAQFIGKAGIHGIGISRAQQAIQVYVGPVPSSDQQAVLNQLRQAAAPYHLMVVGEEPPQIRKESKET